VGFRRHLSFVADDNKSPNNKQQQSFVGCENSSASSSSFSSSSSDPSTPHPQQSQRQMIKHKNMAVLPIAQKTCWLHSLGTISCLLVGYNLWLACLFVGY
jgi:hypothetical protein